MASDEPMTEDQKRIFRETFGVSADQLSANGIDPGDYARRNVMKALEEHEFRAPGVLAENVHYAYLRGKWGMRGYFLIFLAFGFMMLAVGVRSLRYEGLSLAFLDAFAVLWVFVKFLRANREYKEACRRDDVKPLKSGLRQSYSKLRQQAYDNAAAVRTTRSGDSGTGETSDSVNHAVHPIRARPAAWHPDPTGRFPQRYFDGTSWTAWVIDQSGAEIQDPQGAPDPPT